MSNSRPSYYELLGLSPKAGEGDVKKAFIEKAGLLIEAYQVLGDKALRAEYDASLQLGETASGAFDPRAKLRSGPADGAIANLILTLDGRAIIPDQKITTRLLSRIPVDKDVALILSNGSLQIGKLKDLSGSGARIFVRADLKVDDVIEIALEAGEAPFVQAQVARVTLPGREYGVKWLKVFENRLPKGLLSKKTI